VTELDWQAAAEEAALARGARPILVWLAGPVDREADGFRECAAELLVSRPVELPPPDGAADQPARTLRAIIDTGCTDTSIRADLAAELGLPPIGIIEVRTGSSGADTIECQTVLADILLVDSRGRQLRIRQTLTVLDMADEMLLGMDLLSGGVLSVDLIAGIWDWKR
jgi:predicted aspartyl protease